MNEPTGLGGVKKANCGRHPVEAELELVLAVHPAQGLIDFVDIVDLLQAPVAVAETRPFPRC